MAMRIGKAGALFLWVSLGTAEIDAVDANVRVVDVCVHDGLLCRADCAPGRVPHYLCLQP